MKRAEIATTYLAAWLLVFLAAPASAADPLHAADLRLLRVAERLQDANVDLCDRRSPALGAALQSRDQYPDDAQPGFSADVAFAALLPSGAAAQAGIVQGDGLAAVDGLPVRKRPDLATMPLRDSAFAMLADHAEDTQLKLTIVHDGAERTVTLHPPQQCRALVEVLAKGGNVARSNGRVIQISLGLMQEASDPQVAVIFAHELAHSVLHHRDRLSAEGVSKGLGGEFGRDRRLNAEAEIEADRLSVHLLANAGYDPHVAAAFWRSQLGKSVGGGLFRNRIYSSPEERAELLEGEIRDYLAGGPPTWPGHLLSKR